MTNLTPSINASNRVIGSNTLWVIEADYIQNGGAINIQLNSYTIRHLNSGYFISVAIDGGLCGVNSRTEAMRFEFTSSLTDFGLLVEDQPIQLGSQGRFVYASSSFGVTTTTQAASVTPSNNTSSVVIEDNDESNMNRRASVTDVGQANMTPLPPSATSFLNFVVGDKQSATNFIVSSVVMRTVGIDLYINVQATTLLRDFERMTR